MYVNISIHDYLRALMGFHQYDTNLTYDPRVAITEHKNVSRGLGNQVTVEFNLLYRFHCAISQEDEKFTEKFMKEMYVDMLDNQQMAGDKTKAWSVEERKRKHSSPQIQDWDPKSLSLQQFMGLMVGSSKKDPDHPEEPEPCKREFGLKDDEDFSFHAQPRDWTLRR